MKQITESLRPLRPGAAMPVRLCVAVLCATIFFWQTIPPLYAQDNPVYARAGWTTQLSELQHDVSGRAEIIDEKTIRLHDFHYDGLGPEVYATLASENTNEAFEDGIYLQPAFQAELAFPQNVPYNGAALDFTLPDGANLDDYTAISIWCAEFNVNFGSGVFTAPEDYRLFLPAITLPVIQ